MSKPDWYNKSYTYGFDYISSTAGGLINQFGITAGDVVYSPHTQGPTRVAATYSYDLRSYYTATRTVPSAGTAERLRRTQTTSSSSIYTYSYVTHSTNVHEYDTVYEFVKEITLKWNTWELRYLNRYVSTSDTEHWATSQYYKTIFLRSIRTVTYTRPQKETKTNEGIWTWREVIGLSAQTGIWTDGEVYTIRSHEVYKYGSSYTSTSWVQIKTRLEKGSGTILDIITGSITAGTQTYQTSIGTKYSYKLLSTIGQFNGRSFYFADKNGFAELNINSIGNGFYTLDLFTKKKSLDIIKGKEQALPIFYSSTANQPPAMGTLTTNLKTYKGVTSTGTVIVSTKFESDIYSIKSIDDSSLIPNSEFVTKDISIYNTLKHDGNLVFNGMGRYDAQDNAWIAAPILQYITDGKNGNLVKRFYKRMKYTSMTRDAYVTARQVEYENNDHEKKVPYLTQDQDEFDLPVYQTFEYSKKALTTELVNTTTVINVDGNLIYTDTTDAIISKYISVESTYKFAQKTSRHKLTSPEYSHALNEHHYGMNVITNRDKEHFSQRDGLITERTNNKFSPIKNDVPLPRGVYSEYMIPIKNASYVHTELINDKIYSSISRSVQLYKFGLLIAPPQGTFDDSNLVFNGSSYYLTTYNQPDSKNYISEDLSHINYTFFHHKGEVYHQSANTRYQISATMKHKTANYLYYSDQTELNNSKFTIGGSDQALPLQKFGINNQNTYYKLNRYGTTAFVENTWTESFKKNLSNTTINSFTDSEGNIYTLTGRLTEAVTSTYISTRVLSSIQTGITYLVVGDSSFVSQSQMGKPKWIITNFSDFSTGKIATLYCWSKSEYRTQNNASVSDDIMTHYSKITKTEVKNLTETSNYTVWQYDTGYNATEIKGGQLKSLVIHWDTAGSDGLFHRTKWAGKGQEQEVEKTYHDMFNVIGHDNQPCFVLGYSKKENDADLSAGFSLDNSVPMIIQTASEYEKPIRTVHIGDGISASYLDYKWGIKNIEKKNYTTSDVVLVREIVPEYELLDKEGVYNGHEQFNDTFAKYKLHVFNEKYNTGITF